MTTDDTAPTLGDALPITTARARALMLELHKHPNPGLAACVPLLEEVLQECDLAMVGANLVGMVQGYGRLDNLLRTIGVTMRLAR